MPHAACLLEERLTVCDRKLTDELRDRLTQNFVLGFAGLLRDGLNSTDLLITQFNLAVLHWTSLALSEWYRTDQNRRSPALPCIIALALDVFENLVECLDRPFQAGVKDDR